MTREDQLEKTGIASPSRSDFRLGRGILHKSFCTGGGGGEDEPPKFFYNVGEQVIKPMIAIRRWQKTERITTSKKSEADAAAKRRPDSSQFRSVLVSHPYRTATALLVAMILAR